MKLLTKPLTDAKVRELFHLIMWGACRIAPYSADFSPTTPSTQYDSASGASTPGSKPIPSVKRSTI